ncbi:maleylpyruvate isomerase N-terminal domain-containing protein [Actinoplanes hulinensis]|uniref:Maleylpyruvate isomerase N-terminal domain-containing protein n=1 Tax=Actinoplanes hulinensis TaxID=1144547 RepID=A0ABS7B4C4_9ACTN|nr:maleylpyruvate isomerase N-terminal domain-containing protein [Actinoplanes hulinensis]
MIADERRSLADLTDTLTPGQLRAPSLCSAWTVKEVVGHLVTVVATGNGTALRMLARSGFNAEDAGAQRVQRAQGERAAGRHDRHTPGPGTRGDPARACGEPVPAADRGLSGGAHRSADLSAGHPAAAGPDR